MIDKRIDLWSGSEFFSATGGQTMGAMPEGVCGISIDSRTLEGGEAFFAIRGNRFDGHAFVRAAAERGAALAVVEEGGLESPDEAGLPLVIVDDVLQALERLAIAARKRCKGKIIAITGSVGKTTTREMLRTVLMSCGKVHAALASHNNHWGVPLTLSRMPEDTEFGIFEIGMNHPGEIMPLAKMVRPHVAVVTVVAEAHLAAFEDVDGIARAKGEIFSGIESGGEAMINGDDERSTLLLQLAREAGIEHISKFGTSPEARFMIRKVELSKTGSRIDALLDGKPVELESGLPGIHMAHNLMAALGSAFLAGADMRKVVLATGNIGAITGRGEHSVYGEGEKVITLIDESYNANPASMIAAFNILAMNEPADKGRRVAVLGDMLELGESSDTLHKELARPIHKANIDRVWLIGERIATLADELDEERQAGCFETAALAREALLEDLRPGDVVMFKGSLGMRLGFLVEEVKKCLSGKQVR